MAYQYAFFKLGSVTQYPAGLPIPPGDQADSQALYEFYFPDCLTPIGEIIATATEQHTLNGFLNTNVGDATTIPPAVEVGRLIDVPCIPSVLFASITDEFVEPFVVPWLEIPPGGSDNWLWWAIVRIQVGPPSGSRGVTMPLRAVPLRYPSIDCERRIRLGM